MLRIRYWVLLLISVGCVPATTPPQLAFTPGAPVQLINDLYVTAEFAVERPNGWRVITSAATSPRSVIFVSPDDTALILISVAGIGEPPRPQVDEPLREQVREIALGDEQQVAAFISGRESDWAQLEAVFERVVASITDCGRLHSFGDDGIC